MNEGNQIEIIIECALVGAAILGAQKVEFALYGIAAHLNLQDNRVNTLDPEKFLRGDIKNIKLTLGTLVKIVGDELLLSTEELDQFVDERNLIAHNYWRLTKAKIREGRKLDNPEEFLIQFVAKCDYWEKVLSGLIALMKQKAAENENRESELNLSEKESSNLKYYMKAAENHLVKRMKSRSRLRLNNHNLILANFIVRS